MKLLLKVFLKSSHSTDEFYKSFFSVFFKATLVQEKRVAWKQTWVLVLSLIHDYDQVIRSTGIRFLISKAKSLTGTRWSLKSNYFDDCTVSFFLANKIQTQIIYLRSTQTGETVRVENFKNFMTKIGEKIPKWKGKYFSN